MKLDQLGGISVFDLPTVRRLYTHLLPAERFEHSCLQKGSLFATLASALSSAHHCVDLV